jgi:NAD(P)-dependent dehydrogenase (short-subunit alcohol dehydrogenase family)
MKLSALAADELRKQLGHIDVLIANAGITAVTDAAELNLEEFGNVMDVNLMGAVNSVAAVLPEMIKRGPRSPGSDFQSRGLSRAPQGGGVQRQQSVAVIIF